jgi:hypothetical protein
MDHRAFARRSITSIIFKAKATARVGGSSPVVTSEESRRFQPRQLRLEIEPQLHALVFRQAAGHLGENCAIERRAMVVPRHRLRRAHLRQNRVQFGANLLRVGISRGRLALLGVVIVPEQVALAG